LRGCSNNLISSHHHLRLSKPARENFNNGDLRLADAAYRRDFTKFLAMLLSYSGMPVTRRRPLRRRV
jgi:hypothetical protein